MHMEAQFRLETIVRDIGPSVVAFSGGVDSALVSLVAHRVLGDACSAVTAVSPSLSARGLDDAVMLARRYGWDHVLVDTAEVTQDRYAANDPDRCYWCKTELFERLEPFARSRGATLLSGANADDAGDLRPGARAAREQMVRAPLAEAGLTKEDVRTLSEGYGLDGARRPASPCLSSRIAYGVKVTPERLRRIEGAEELMRDLGFSLFRVRDHGSLARIEVGGAADMTKMLGLRQEIEGALKRLGWTWVTLDLGGFRSGSMNAILAPPRMAPPG